MFALSKHLLNRDVVTAPENRVHDARVLDTWQNVGGLPSQPVRAEKNNFSPHRTL